VLKISWGISAIGLILLFSCFLLSIIGLGTCLASFVKSKKQLASITNIIVMPTSLIAGCMWPRDIMPDFMIKISNFIPQTWVLKGMTDLITRNSGVNAILIPSAVLLLFASVFFIVGISLNSMQRD
jgi:ABC-2 type transport system permease protein